MNTLTVNSTSKVFAKSYLTPSEGPLNILTLLSNLPTKSFIRKEKLTHTENVLLGIMVDTVMQVNKTDQMLALGNIDEVQFLVNSG